MHVRSCHVPSDLNHCYQTTLHIHSPNNLTPSEQIPSFTTTTSVSLRKKIIFVILLQTLMRVCSWWTQELVISLSVKCPVKRLVLVFALTFEIRVRD